MKPRILILDEGTSALDNTTQAAVMENLNRMQVTRGLFPYRTSGFSPKRNTVTLLASDIVRRPL